MNKFALMLLVSGLVTSAGAQTPDKAPEMVKVEEYPHAGIALAVPKGFVYLPPGKEFEVMRAGLVKENGDLDIAVTLSVYPVAEGVTIDRYADATVDGVRRGLRTRKLRQLKNVRMTVADHECTVRLLSFLYLGVPRYAAMACVIRDVEGTKIRLAYVLVVECGEGCKDKLLGAYEAVVKSIRFTKIRRPASLGIRRLEDELKVHRWGFAVRRPKGWFAALAPAGVEMFQTDYLMGGIRIPYVRISVERVGSDETAQSCGQSNLAIARKQAKDRNASSEVISTGMKKLGEKEAFQSVLKISAPTNRVDSDRTHDWTTVIVTRTFCRIDPNTGWNVSCHVMLTCLDSEPRDAAAMMDKLAEGFRLLEMSATGPGATTAPTTAPATETAPAK